MIHPLNCDVPKYITLEEIKRAEREILKHVQRRAFPEEFNHPEKPVKVTSNLCGATLFEFFFVTKIKVRQLRYHFPKKCT